MATRKTVSKTLTAVKVRSVQEVTLETEYYQEEISLLDLEAFVHAVREFVPAGEATIELGDSGFKWEGGK